MVVTDPDLPHAPAPVHAHPRVPDIAGEARDMLRIAILSVGDHLVVGDPQGGMFTAQRARALDPARDHLFVEDQIGWVRGGDLRVTSGVVMVEYGGRGRGVTRCARVVLVQGLFRVLARVQCRILRIRGTVGAEVGLGLLVGGGEAIVGTISGTADQGRQGIKMHSSDFLVRFCLLPALNHNSTVVQMSHTYTMRNILDRIIWSIVQACLIGEGLLSLLYYISQQLMYELFKISSIYAVQSRSSIHDRVSSKQI